MHVFIFFINVLRVCLIMRNHEWKTLDIWRNCHFQLPRQYPFPPAVSLRRRESISSILDTEQDTPASEQGPGQCDKGTLLSTIQGL